MIDFKELEIDKSSLYHNDRVLVVDTSEYNQYNQVVLPFLATVKKTDKEELYFECDDNNDELFSDYESYIVIRLL